MKNIQITGLLTDKQSELIQTCLSTQNTLYDYSLRFLEKTYGRKHVYRNMDTTNNYEALIKRLHEVFLQYRKLEHWTMEDVGIPLEATEAILLPLILKFEDYKKVLKETAKWTDEEKAEYKEKNRRAWYRHKAVPHRQKTEYITLHQGVIVKAPNQLYVSDFGDIQTVENIQELTTSEIKAVKIKYQDDNKASILIEYTDQP
jgi:putative transposase